MRPQQKHQQKTLKRKIKEYNSDSDEMDAKDLDLLTNDDAFSIDSYDHDKELEETEKKEPKEKMPQQSTEELNKQRSLKLSNVLSKLIGADTPDMKRPILAKKKHIEAELDDAKLAAKAKKLLAAEKKTKLDVGRVIPDHTTTDGEKQLRKLATKGGICI